MTVILYPSENLGQCGCLMQIITLFSICLMLQYGL